MLLVGGGDLVQHLPCAVVGGDGAEIGERKLDDVLQGDAAGRDVSRGERRRRRDVQVRIWGQPHPESWRVGLSDQAVAVA